MPNFTEEQLQELEKVFNLTRKETLPVRDGRVAFGDLVWWRCVHGPVRESVDGTIWENIAAHPEHYQLARPTVKTEYLD